MEYLENVYNKAYKAIKLLLAFAKGNIGLFRNL
jgi:hypothetical protein